MKPNLILFIAVILSGISAMVMFYLNKDILKPPPVEKVNLQASSSMQMTQVIHLLKPIL